MQPLAIPPEIDLPKYCTPFDFRRRMKNSISSFFDWMLLRCLVLATLRIRAQILPVPIALIRGRNHGHMGLRPASVPQVRCRHYSPPALGDVGKTTVYEFRMFYPWDFADNCPLVLSVRQSPMVYL